MNESTLTANHCDATDAGEIAQDAVVQTLVLTHSMPYRDLESWRRDAESAFDGEVLVAEDERTLSPKRSSLFEAIVSFGRRTPGVERSIGSSGTMAQHFPDCENWG